MRRLVTAALVLLLAGVPVPAEARPAQAAAGCAADDPFTAEFGQIVESRWPGHHVTAAVYDTRTGCSFGYRPERRVGTASVLKVQLYAGILLRAQNQGRWLTPSEQQQAWPMITQSANPPASAFWSSLGGVSGMRSLDATFGMTETTPQSPWGLTITSAADQVRLLRQVVVGEYGPLQPRYRDALFTAMQSVVPEQRWGISAGVPPEWAYGLKNGFADSVCCNWRVNSVGWVPDPGGGGYVIAVLSDGWPTEAPGHEADEFVSRAVAERLARQPYGAFASRRDFVARQYQDLFGRAPDLGGSLFWGAAAGWHAANDGGVVDALLAYPASGHGDAVTTAYQAVLGRTPDLGGLDAWRDAVRRGASDPSLYDAFVGSAEYQGDIAGLDAAGIVRLGYERALGREPDQGGLDYWSPRVQSLGPAGLLRALAGSPEGRARLQPAAVVVQLYDGLLHRIPGADEVAFWVGRTGADRRALAHALLGSDEYRGLVGG